MPSIISFLTRPIIAIVYLVLSFRLIIIKGLEFKNESIQAKLIYKWLLLLISVSLILYLGFLLFTFMSFYLRTTNLVDNSGVLILYATIAGLFTLNLSLLFFPNILYGLPQLDYAIVTKQNKVLEQELGIAEDFKKQAKGFEISTEKLNLLKLKVDEYIIKKPYLNSAFNLTMMSNDTDIPVHHLSYFFNEHIKVNFNSWKNNLKIDYVLEKINEGTNEILTLDALSKQAGFGSRSSFFIAFKQKMGVTPTEYIQSID
jgi:AraC-like DNA-binding protein